MFILILLIIVFAMELPDTVAAFDRIMEVPYPMSQGQLQKDGLTLAFAAFNLMLIYLITISGISFFSLIPGSADECDIITSGPNKP